MSHFIQSPGQDQLSYDKAQQSFQCCLVEMKKSVQVNKTSNIQSIFCSAWKNPVCLTSAVFTRCSEMTQSKKNLHAAKLWK